MNFRELHQQHEPLVVCNVWDVVSARVAEKLGFMAIGTSSAAIARSLGYEDGENMNFGELVAVVARIAACVRLPISVDIESGYGDDTEAVGRNATLLAELGVVGVNIGDSCVCKAERRLVCSAQFSHVIRRVKSLLKAGGHDVFINVRTDTYLLDVVDKQAQTVRRMGQYAEAGPTGYLSRV